MPFSSSSSPIPIIHSPELHTLDSPSAIYPPEASTPTARYIDHYLPVLRFSRDWGSTVQVADT